MIQKSYKSEKGILYIVPTPIGNMNDITLRAINTLESVDLIFAEDTRVTKLLLNHFNISKKIISCHKFNEMKASALLIKELELGKNVALVSDRGTPLISDPGYIIVGEVIKANYNVVALPGPSAFLPALNMSGIQSDKFLFYGFLDKKEMVSEKELRMLNDINFTIVLYETPHRLDKTLRKILKILGNRHISISREISKVFEEVFRGSVNEAIEQFNDVKGEIVIVIEKAKRSVNYDEAIVEVKKLVEKGISSKEAIKEISKNCEISKNVLYNMYEEQKK